MKESSNKQQVEIPDIPTSPPPVRMISRDEMNLAEFPLTVLSTRATTSGKVSSVKTLEFADQVRGKNGELVTRQWIITGADKFGLPTSSDDEVLLGLLKLTVDSGFKDRKISFSRYELLKILRWTTEGRSYIRLQRALDRLSGVRVKATNAFYDNESKAHSTRNFGLIDAYEINDGRALDSKPSFFIWSEVLFKSYQAGFIKKFDLDFYLGLKSAVSKRLYRYLDKHFWYRAKVQINLFTLAHEKIGVSRNYKYASSLKQQLDPALEELCEMGFVSRFEYSGKGTETELAIYAALGKPRVQQRTDEAAGVRPNPTQQPLVVKEEVGFSTEEVPGLAQGVNALLVARGLKEAQVVRLLSGKTEVELEKLRKIVEHFDKLCSSGSRLVSKSPVGFLYRAIENFENFVLPTDYSHGVGGQGASNRPSLKPVPNPAVKTVRDHHEAEYLLSRKREIRSLRDSLDSEMLSKIESEAKEALRNVAGLISESRFQEAVEHHIEEKIAKLFAVSSFEEWMTAQGTRAAKKVRA